MESVMLDKLEVKNNRVDYYFTPTTGLKKYFKHNNIFIEYDIDLSDVPVSILVIPFVANVLPLMWLIDGILWVTDIDRTFYDAIPRIKYAYQELYPHYKLKGTIVPAYTTENTYLPEREAILLFSGGLDSNATFIRIRDKFPVLLNIQGWFQSEINDNRVYDADKQDITKFSLMQGMQANFVRSNFASLINSAVFNKKISKKLKESYWYGFQHATGFISIASVLAFQLKVKNIYIASSNTLGYRKACASDPTSDIQFKFASSGGVIHDGFELTRQDKSKIIVNYQKINNYDYHLRVCNFNDKNCCECEKCFRTILGIVAEGGDISKFSFLIREDLLTHFTKVISNIMLDFPDYSEEIYMNTIKKRMIENKSNINEHEFVYWFLNYNFKRHRNKAIVAYRAKNFFSILKRKIANILH